MGLFFLCLHVLVVRVQMRREEALVNFRVERRVAEIVSHGGAISELQFGGAQRKIVGRERNLNLWHQAARGSGPRLERDFAEAVALRERRDLETAFQLRLAAREARLQQG